MLRKKLGIEAIERNWSYSKMISAYYFKIPSILTIPESCRKIGAAAFCGCGSLELKKVIIPRSVESIGDWAFWGCDNAEIILKKAKSEFKGYQAFGDCKYVKEETGD